MTEQSALLVADLPELESGHVQTVAEPRGFPRRGVAVAAGFLGMMAVVAMWASGERGGLVQGKADAVVALQALHKKDDGSNVSASEQAAAAAFTAAVAQAPFDVPVAGTGSCKALGCSAVYVRHRPCQCNGACVSVGDCCSDYTSRCGKDLLQEELHWMLLQRASSPGGVPQSVDGAAGRKTTPMLSIFKMIDKDSDGNITAIELHQWSFDKDNKNLYQSSLTGDDIQDFIHNADQGDGTVDFEEFRSGSHRTIRGKEFKSHPQAHGAVHYEMQMLQAFGALDKTEKGTINGTDIQEALEGKMPKEEVDKIVGLADNNEDKKIDYGEFKTWLSSEEFADKKDKLFEILEHNSAIYHKQQEEFKKTFDIIDENGDLSLTGKELGKWVSRKGHKPSDEAIKVAIGEYDRDGNGEVNLEEFKSHQEFKKIFDIIDENGDLRITGKELGNWSRDMGKNLSGEEIKGWIGEFDQDKSGNITLEEFKSHPTAQWMVESEMRTLENFDAFDTNRDKTISGSEIREVLKGWGEFMLKEEVDTIVGLADNNGEYKTIDYEEFKKLTFRQVFKIDRGNFMKIDYMGFGPSVKFIHILVDYVEWKPEAYQKHEDDVKKREDEFNKTFASIDKNGDRSLTGKELDNLVSHRGHEPSDEEIKGATGEYDRDKNGKVNFEEFKSHPQAQWLVESEMQMLENFDAFDTNKDKTIRGSEIRKVLEVWYKFMSKEDVHKIVGLADNNGDWQIDYEEFKKWMNSKAVADTKAMYKFSQILHKQKYFVQTHDNDTKKVFDTMDKDKDNIITGDELAKWISRMGYEPPKEEINDMIREFDQGDDQVDLEEFKSLLVSQGAVDNETQVLGIFGAFDTDKNHKVDDSEIEKALESYGEKIPKEDIAKIIEAADGDGKLDYDEFLRFSKRYKDAPKE